MRDPRTFYARVCFILFIHVQFSNAANRIRINNPSATFKYAASLHSLFVQAPNQNEFTQHSSAKPMFLTLHTDGYTLSFYESDSPYTFLTFQQRQVDFELLYAQTMIFTVRDGSNSWHFRCIVSADQNIFDVMYSSLSISTGIGSMVYRMRIDKVESYLKMDNMQNPIVETVEGLQPAMLYDQGFLDKSSGSSKKIYSITQLNDVDATRTVSRLVFRTGSFQVFQIYDLVVLHLSACPNWYYIFYFRNTQQARRFVKYLAPSESFVLPPDVKYYVETGAMSALSTAVNESTSGDSQPGGSSSSNSTRKQPQSEEAPPEIKRRQRRPKTVFTTEQSARLQQVFAVRRYVDRKEREQLAAELNLHEAQVQNWFQYERDKGH